MENIHLASGASIPMTNDNGHYVQVIMRANEEGDGKHLFV